MLKCTAEVRGLFKDRKLIVDNGVVLDGGVCGLDDPQEETYTCPKCGLIWDDYIFSCVVDWCCRCGTVMVGPLLDGDTGEAVLTYFAQRVSINDYGCEPPDYEGSRRLGLYPLEDFYNRECDFVEEAVWGEYIATGGFPAWLTEAFSRYGCFMVGDVLWAPEKFCIF